MALNELQTQISLLVSQINNQPEDELGYRSRR